MPRKVVTRNPHREVGVLNPGWLLDHPVEHESNLEKNFIMVALACPVVKDIVHQPITLTLVHPNGESQKYTPDFRVRLTDDTQIIVEVKPEVFVAENKVKHDLAKGQLASEGTPFLVVTEKHINANGLSARAILLMRYGRLSFDEDSALECKQLLEEEFRGSAQVHELVSKGVSESLVWKMVAAHQLRVPVGLNINPQETVELNTQKGDCHDYFCTWFGIA
ncbi:MAG: TnsA endonuclease N-terminal domain-containing protein [Rhodoferax sp.]